MEHNIICIDPSLSCTAVVVNDKKAVFTLTSTAYTKKLKPTKWFDLCHPYLDVFCHDFDKTKMSFSDSELSKFQSYDSLTNDIVGFIERVAIRGLPNPSKVYIEGYSFSSAAGPLIDLVTFGTLLRSKIRSGITTDITTITPSELKLLAAKLTYPVTVEKKKETWRNHQGVAGGSFKKHDIMKALIENNTLQCEWVNFLRAHSSDILAATSVPKPIEDMNDAKMMYEIVKSNKYL